MKIKVKIITGVHTRQDMRYVSHLRNNENNPELQPNFICLISSLSYEMIKCANKLCICLVNQRTIAQSVTRWHVECQHCLEEPRSTPLAFSPYSIPVHLPAIACLFYRLKLWNLQNLGRMFFLSLYLHREPEWDLWNSFITFWGQIEMKIEYAFILKTKYWFVYISCLMCCGTTLLYSVNMYYSRWLIKNWLAGSRK